MQPSNIRFLNQLKSMHRNRRRAHQENIKRLELDELQKSENQENYDEKENEHILFNF